MNALLTLMALVAPTSGVAARTAPDPVTRQHLLTLAAYQAVYPDMRDPSRIVLRSPVFAPSGCDDQRFNSADSGGSSSAGGRHLP